MAKTHRKSGGRRRDKRHVSVGNVYIQATFNNTIITITDDNGDVFAWSSAGSRGFKGAKKGTAYAAGIACETALRKAMDAGVREVSIYSTGPGSGKESAIRMVAQLGLKVRLIKDVTPVPHNGCRPRGRRRV